MTTWTDDGKLVETFNHEFKTDIVLPFETPEGTPYETNQVSMSEVLDATKGWSPSVRLYDPMTGEIVNVPFGDDWSAVFTGSRPSIWQSTISFDDLIREEFGNYTIEDLYGIDLYVFENGRRALSSELVNELTEMGYKIVGNGTAGELVSRYRNYNSSFEKDSGNTSGTVVADEWIDVYYYYNVSSQTVTKMVEIEDEP